MKTDDLVAMLSKGAVAVEPDATARRFKTALGWGLFGATLVMAVWLGVRPDIRQAAMLSMFWMKVGSSSLIAVAAYYAAARLARPGMRLGRAPVFLAAIFLLIWLLGAAALAHAEPQAREYMIFGDTWKVCPLNIAMISAPLFTTAMWAMKGLAPTRPTLAGGATGLLSGAMSAAVYSLHCPEMSVTFFGIWYVIGMFIPAVLGALAGPRLLHW